MTQLVVQQAKASEEGTLQRQVIVQKWEESERGWGTRPDGYTLHCTMDDLKAFIDAYWARMPDRVPSVYSRPDGTPYTAWVDEELYEKVKASGNGMWGSDRSPPGSGGSDGWVRIA